MPCHESGLRAGLPSVRGDETPFEDLLAAVQNTTAPDAGIVPAATSAGEPSTALQPNALAACSILLPAPVTVPTGEELAAENARPEATSDDADQTTGSSSAG